MQICLSADFLKTKWQREQKVVLQTNTSCCIVGHVSSVTVTAERANLVGAVRPDITWILSQLHNIQCAVIHVQNNYISNLPRSVPVALRTKLKT